MSLNLDMGEENNLARQEIADLIVKLSNLQRKYIAIKQDLSKFLHNYVTQLAKIIDIQLEEKCQDNGSVSKLYRKLLFDLHPDTAFGHNDLFSLFFESIQTAAKNNDIDMLHNYQSDIKLIKQNNPDDYLGKIIFLEQKIKKLEKDICNLEHSQLAKLKDQYNIAKINGIDLVDISVQFMSGNIKYNA